MLLRPGSVKLPKASKASLSGQETSEFKSIGTVDFLVPLQIDPGTMALVVAAYETQYPDPLSMNAGDALKIVKQGDDEWPGWVFCESRSGKRGWVPEKSIKIDGEGAVAQNSYLAREVTVMEGEIVRIENVESGWAWVTNMTDQTGGVPLKNLKIVE